MPLTSPEQWKDAGTRLLSEHEHSTTKLEVQNSRHRMRRRCQRKSYNRKNIHTRNISSGLLASHSASEAPIPVRKPNTTPAARPSLPKKPANQAKEQKKTGETPRPSIACSKTKLPQMCLQDHRSRRSPRRYGDIPHVCKHMQSFLLGHSGVATTLQSIR